MKPSFEQLHVDVSYVETLTRMGITEPTPIQEEAIPALLSGQDVIAQSATGSGKTLAYVLPALHNIDPDDKHVQVMIIVPTRELGMQIVQVVQKLTEGGSIRIQPLIGGASLSRQVDKLKEHPHMVVGTPGRIKELIQMRKLSVHFVKTVIVDEVDQVFELGNMQEVEAVLKAMLKSKQVAFFSATMPPRILETAERWMQDPIKVQIKLKQPAHEHLYVVCEERDKIDMLRRLVRHYNPLAAIVFINDTDDIGEVLAKLQYVGLSVAALYGDSGKQERAKVMQDFRNNKFQLLLATDVAARGLDIEGVSHVINLDPPLDADHYVHRIGRTGRMGRKGTAISIVTPKQTFIMKKFSQSLHVPFHKKVLYGGNILNPEELPARKKRLQTNSSQQTTKVKKTVKQRERDRKQKGRPKRFRPE